MYISGVDGPKATLLAESVNLYLEELPFKYWGCPFPQSSLDVRSWWIRLLKELRIDG